ncbi:MAG: ABC transporter ATP-binding protein, partial [Mesorhizobium sp.]
MIDSSQHKGSLLEVDGLSVDYGLKGVSSRAIDRISFELRAGEAVGLVG